MIWGDLILMFSGVPAYALKRHDAWGYLKRSTADFGLIKVTGDLGFTT